jgi:transposase-like protein
MGIQPRVSTSQGWYNPTERLNDEIKRRSDVVGILRMKLPLTGSSAPAARAERRMGEQPRKDGVQRAGYMIPTRVRDDSSIADVG